MKQYIAEEAKPNPKSTINSYRSFGYTLSTAISDIIDNSISAKASEIYIDFIWQGKDSYISISDNGIGMNLGGLIAAMTPGSKDPDDFRHEGDLGRFGMGLKTASFSQCKRLTVSTKQDGVLHNRCWDIDFVNEVEAWTLLNFISNPELTHKINTLNSGSVIIWEKLDRIVGNSDTSNEAVKSAFYHELKIVRDHIALVFHKFIENKKVQIIINDSEVEPWNPFLLDLNPKPEMGLPEILNGKVEVVYYILPHMSRISHLDYEKSGGPLGWYQQQGFYIYRGDRLLVAGDWLGLEKQREYSKLVRISINFTNTSDFDWHLDIKKSTASPPFEIRKDLKRIAKLACLKSAQIYNWRGQKSFGVNNEPHSIQTLWYEEVNRENVKKYKINKKHTLIKRVLDLDKSGNHLFSKALKLIEENIPVELILYNQNEDPSQHEIEKIADIPADSLIDLAVELYSMNIEMGVPKELAAQQIMNSMPFNQFPLINDYLR
ncbi:ATP-binding protein [Pedobacter sp. AW31-3R]|uniref:ATP-binding protein n=1 Tax=Pedobacter sp. AW31-3R TaxID=3445781 RepID=UPI003F9F6C17